MQLLVCGAIRMTGKSAKGPYDMAKLITLTPTRPLERPDFKRDGAGFESVEADADPAVLEAVRAVKLPAYFEVDGEPRQSGDKVTFFVTAIRPVK